MGFINKFITGGGHIVTKNRVFTNAKVESIKQRGFDQQQWWLHQQQIWISLGKHRTNQGLSKDNVTLETLNIWTRQFRSLSKKRHWIQKTRLSATYWCLVGNGEWFNPWLWIIIPFPSIPIHSLPSKTKLAIAAPNNGSVEPTWAEVHCWLSTNDHPSPGDFAPGYSTAWKTMALYIICIYGVCIDV